jgi:hypothetical protein
VETSEKLELVSLPHWNALERSGMCSIAISSYCALINAYRFRQKADILPDIITTLFPTLVAIADGMLNTSPSQPASQEIPAMLHIILKTYKTAIIVNLSPHQQSSESLVPWGRLLFRTVQMNIPVEGLPSDEEEREKCEWWKAKKWAYGILGRLFHRCVLLQIFNSCC